MLGELGARNPGKAIAIACLVMAAGLPWGGASADTVYLVTPSDDVQAVIDAAQPGDTVRLAAGTYTGPLVVETRELTLEGAGQGLTILDGTGIDKDGILVLADGVSVRDLTVRNFGGNGVVYTDATGFYVDRVTATDNGPYGIYAIRSRVGHIRDSTATGHSDSGMYIGETESCECVLERLVARGNLIGYSGTGASHLVIRDSLWEDNAAGIVPNVLPTEPQPQTDLVIIDNVVRNNNNVAASEMWHFGGFLHVPAGLGIVVAGGVSDLVTGNEVTGHTLAGVTVVFLFVEPSFNEIVGNTLDNAGPDILWDEGGVNNCFEDNLRPDGGPATFDAGPVWGTLGALPACDTPNAGAPNPVTLARLGTLLIFGCEPDQMPGDPCHTEFEGPYEH